MKDLGTHASKLICKTSQSYQYNSPHIRVIPWQDNSANAMMQQILESKQMLIDGEILAIVLKGKGTPLDEAPSPTSPAVHKYGHFVNKATDSISNTKDFLINDLPHMLGMRQLNRPCEINDNTSPVQHEVANNPGAMGKIEPLPDIAYRQGELELVARVAMRNRHQRATTLRNTDSTKETSIVLASGDILITNAQKTLVGHEAEPKYEPNGYERTWTAKVHFSDDNNAWKKQ